VSLSVLVKDNLWKTAGYYSSNAPKPSMMTWLTWAWAAGLVVQRSRLLLVVESSIKLLYILPWR